MTKSGRDFFIWNTLILVSAWPKISNARSWIECHISLFYYCSVWMLVDPCIYLNRYYPSLFHPITNINKKTPTYQHYAYETHVWYLTDNQQACISSYWNIKQFAVLYQMFLLHQITAHKPVSFGSSNTRWFS